MFTIRIAKKLIADLVSDLRTQGYHPTKVVLFGSVAKGKAHRYSDVDVAIWDEKFTGCRPIDQEAVIKVLHRYPRVELHSFHASETSIDNPFIKEIDKSGIAIPLAKETEEITSAEL